MANVKRKYCQRRGKGKQFLCGYWVKNILGGRDYSVLSYLTQDKTHFFEDYYEVVPRVSVSGKRDIFKML